MAANSYKYAAFISYAHADEPVAKKLHAALEIYPLPKGMDASARQKLTPIFRDVTELTAHHSLSEKIKDAVEHSRFLIVLCSPAAKASHWVNEEIRLFRRLHGEGSILSVIVEGDPAPAFPPALTEDGREPLAADISGREGFRFGVTQLAASLLGVGLDTLVQRDQKRRRRRSQSISVVTTALAFIMGGLAYTAIDARDEAEVSRNEAEKMVEFMIKDLKEELDEVGKLSILNGVGERVSDYYDAIPLSDMDDDRLARRAKARHLLGEVALDQAEYDRAEKNLKAAFDATEEILKRYPDDADAIYNHAQSEFWVGAVYYYQDKFYITQPYWERYNEHAQSLYRNDPENHQMAMEAGWGANNLGSLYRQVGEIELARSEAINGIKFFGEASRLNSKDYKSEKELANAYSIAGRIEENAGNMSDALKFREQEYKIYSNLHAERETDFDLRYRRIQSGYRLFKLRSFNACQNTKMLALTSEMQELVEYEENNKRWGKELLRQLQHQLSTCLDNQLPISKSSLDKFLSMAENYQADEDINQLKNQLVSHPNYSNKKITD